MSFASDRLIFWQMCWIQIFLCLIFSIILRQKSERKKFANVRFRTFQSLTDIWDPLLWQPLVCWINSVDAHCAGLMMHSDLMWWPQWCKVDAHCAGLLMHSWWFGVTATCYHGAQILPTVKSGRKSKRCRKRSSHFLFHFEATLYRVLVCSSRSKKLFVRRHQQAKTIWG